MSRSPKGNNHAPPSEFVQKEGYSSVKKKLLMEEVLPEVEEREELVNDLEGEKEELSEEKNEEVIVQGEFQQYQHSAHSKTWNLSHPQMIGFAEFLAN